MYLLLCLIPLMLSWPVGGSRILHREIGLCPNVTSCHCTKHPTEASGIMIKCTGATDEDFNNLPDAARINVTELTVTECKLANLSSLGLWRGSQFKEILDITISNTPIEAFTWKWVPENRLHILRLTNTDTIDFVSNWSMLSEQDEYMCRTAHIKKMRTLFLMHQYKMKTVPSCIPDVLESLHFMHFPLSGLAETVEDNGRTVIKWPGSLFFLSFFNNSIKELSDRVFKQPPQGLRKLFIKKQPLKDSSILRQLPASSLTCLRLTLCEINHISREDFEAFRRNNILETLDLSHNELTSIPASLPASIRTLYLQNNSIATINVSALAHLNSLTTLNLNQNLIRSIPKGLLPIYLLKLEMRRNKITTCDIEAFIKLEKLETLDLSDNELTSMPMNLPRSMRYYYLERNKISGIGAKSNYDFCANCLSFRLNGNPWSCDSHMVDFLLWANINGFKEFSLLALTNKNDVFSCESNPFRGLDNTKLEFLVKYMKEVQELGCTYNVNVLNCTGVNLKHFPTVVKGLQKVYISKNPSIGNVPNMLFGDLQNLEILELNWDGLTRIPHGLPHSIIKLSLIGNEISTITDEDVLTLRNLTKIKTLFLDKNKFTTFIMAYVAPSRTLNLVTLKENPLICDCTIWPFIEWMQAKFRLSQREYGTCMGPAAIRGKGLGFLGKVKYFQYNTTCIPMLCSWDGQYRLINCSYAQQASTLDNHPHKEAIQLGKLPEIRRSQYWKCIDATGMKLENADINLMHLSSLDHAIFSNNSLQYFPLEGLPKSIVHLTLDHNNISTLPSLKQVKRYLPKLQYIDIRKNNIRMMKEDNVRLFPSLRSVLLHGNPLMCTCKLQPFIDWISTNLHIENPHQIKSLECYGPKAMQGKLLYRITEAEYCPEINVSGITGGLVGTVIFFTVTAILVNIYLHKKRKKREREDILCGFRELLQREAGFDDKEAETGILIDDRFMYDAFVSYSPHEEDSDFAMLMLDELETKRQYKLCVHERDFMPGIGIADNIVECIGASKRIILILSRNFVSSPWCQYEVQVALAELHQKRRSKLLVPVLLEDIEEDDTIAGSVKIFLSLIQGIKIPDNEKISSWKEFWNRLIEAMPDEPIPRPMP